MMPSVDCFVGRPNLRIAAFLSTITLLGLSGCGGTGDTLPLAPPTGGSGGPNAAPTISGSPALAVMPGQTYSFTPQASDPNGDNLTFQIENRPTWATFDAQTGRLSGTPTAANVGSYGNVVISVSDGTVRASLPAFAINVNVVASGVATLSWTAPTTNTDGTPLTSLSGYRIYFGRSPDGFTNTLEVSNAGLTTYVVDNLVSGTWYFAVSAINDAGQESPVSNTASKTVS